MKLKNFRIVALTYGQVMDERFKSFLMNLSLLQRIFATVLLSSCAITSGSVILGSK